MTSVLRFLLAASLISLTLSCIRVEQPIDGTPVPPGAMLEGGADAEFTGSSWRSLPVHYCLVPGDGFVSQERLAAAAAEAFAEWGLQVIDDGSCPESIEGNGRNEISWSIPPDQGSNLHEAASTRLTLKACSGFCPGGTEPFIAEADILVHPQPPNRMRNERCLYAALLHETGHFLGMPHLDTEVMRPISNACAQELSARDREVLDGLYR